MTAPLAHRFATLGIGLVLAGIGAGCAQREPTPDAKHDVETASPLMGLSERTLSAVGQTAKMHRLMIGKLPGMQPTVVDACQPGTIDGMRLTVSHSRHRSATFVVDIVADPRGGGDATWRVFTWDRSARAYVAVPPRGVRLDGKGWREARALVADPRFTLLPPVDEGGLDGATWVLESCLRGHYTFVSRWEARATDQTDFVRVARGLVALTGSACRLPGETGHIDQHVFEGPPPC